MPHAHSSSAASSGGDDLGSTDEVKVFKDEGDGEDEKRSSENLLEEKSSLIDWTESECCVSSSVVEWSAVCGLVSAVFPNRYDLGSFKKPAYQHLKGRQRTCGFSGIADVYGRLLTPRCSRF
ncbi:Protein pangolin, isoforms A/H/I [Papilio xuthus]|uniref:Protein pangolin, isoforms A/H/I n=1 Tax=Papilio xuthus TaxID=66420 RepID=A0A194PXH2_PAPXU|nr:Protein pangolin, isoforms A/H/I [Papilio xuthus]